MIEETLSEENRRLVPMKLYEIELEVKVGGMLRVPAADAVAARDLAIRLVALTGEALNNALKSNRRFTYHPKPFDIITLSPPVEVE